MQYMTLSIGKFKGLNNVLPAHEHVDVQFVGRTAISEAWLVDSTNLDITDSFKLVMRDGFAEVYASTNVHSLWSDGKTCLFREGSTLRKLNPDFTSTILRTGLSGKAVPMAYLSLVDKIYYSDGIATGIIENGASRSWGLVTPFRPTLSETDGYLPEGTYQVSLVYKRSDGQISGGSNQALIKVNVNKGILISNIIASDDDVASIDVYVSSANGEALYPYVRLENKNQNYTVLVEGATNSGLSLATIGLINAPSGDIIDYYNGRIYVANGNIVWYSEPLLYELFRLRSNYLIFESPVAVLSSVRNGIWVATEKKTYFLSGDNPPFKFNDKQNYGGIKGTSQKIPSASIKKEYQDSISMWATSMGVCVGFSDGTFENLTGEYYRFDNASSGVSLFRTDKGIHKYIVSLYN